MLAECRRFPGQFWLLALGTLVFNLAIGLGMPYETIYLTDTRHVPVSTVGALWTISALVSLPMLIVSGRIADVRGRRILVLVAVGDVVFFYTAMALSREVWQFFIVLILEGLFGWPMFLTGANAMVADLVEPERRPEGYAVLRTAMSAGIVVGPLIAWFTVANGATYSQMFLSAASGCAVVLVVFALWVKETRHLAVAAVGELQVVAKRTGGYGQVLADRPFLLFSAVALLPLFAYGQFLWIVPLFLRRVLDVPGSYWSLLLFVNGLTLSVVQYPLVRAVKRLPAMTAMAVASVGIAVGTGGFAFATAAWQAVPLVVVFSLGEAIMWPVSSAVIAELSPRDARGRYMGAWTIVDCGGRGLGPFFGGEGMDRIGGRRTFAIVLVLGLVGAALFPALRRREQRRPVASEAEPTQAEPS